MSKPKGRYVTPNAKISFASTNRFDKRRKQEQRILGKTPSMIIIDELRNKK
jgi:hypothetical protein